MLIAAASAFVALVATVFFLLGRESVHRRPAIAAVAPAAVSEPAVAVVPSAQAAPPPVAAPASPTSPPIAAPASPAAPPI
ncbi:MAG TPA: hypothetical protein VFP84_00160, partial [Kofleriaceae bacterium]|nr:hypothetical protein [Kofleriaceae bacterium]